MYIKNNYYTIKFFIKKTCIFKGREAVSIKTYWQLSFGEVIKSSEEGSENPERSNFTVETHDVRSGTSV